MSYYVTVIDGPRVGYLVGPFNRHGDALKHVKAAIKKAQDVDPKAWWYAYGTAHVKTSTATKKIGPGKLNELLGVTHDREEQAA